MSRYKISILTLQGKTLTFHVFEYNITKGDFIEFTDEVTGKTKRFHSSRTEIDEVPE